MGITIVQNIHDAVNKLQLVPLCERHFQLFRIAVLYKHYNSRPSARGIMEGIAIKRRSSYYNSCPSARGIKGHQKAIRNFSDYNSHPSKMGITIVQNIREAVNKLQLVPLCEGYQQST